MLFTPRFLLSSLRCIFGHGGCQGLGRWKLIRLDPVGLYDDVNIVTLVNGVPSPPDLVDVCVRRDSVRESLRREDGAPWMVQYIRTNNIYRTSSRYSMIHTSYDCVVCVTTYVVRDMYLLLLTMFSLFQPRLANGKDPAPLVSSSLVVLCHSTSVLSIHTTLFFLTPSSPPTQTHPPTPQDSG